MLSFKLSIILTMAFASSLYAGNSGSSCQSQGLSIVQKLGCIPGLTVKEITNKQSPAGTRQFDLFFTQKVDHSSVQSQTFQQRLVLTHRSEAEPVLLHTSGYDIFGVAESTVARLYKINQLQVEHRYFAKSIPSVIDWANLNVFQSANDFHEIVQAFKVIYPAAWVNTGASKGGMTSFYHRAYFPDDVVGTIADVAPLSFSTDDTRYAAFLNSVGGDFYKSCRENLKQLQIDLLNARDQIVPHLTGDYKQLGSAEVSFEHAVISLPFVFWQYTDPQDQFGGCATIPVSGTTEQKLDFLNWHSPADGGADSEILPFQSYYYQAATELGSPADDLQHLTQLLLHPYNIHQYTPLNVTYSYSNALMIQMDDWARNKVDEVIFVYGEYDPWTAGAFPKTEAGKNVYHFTVAGGNHGAKYTQLAANDKSVASSIISKWLGKAPVMQESDLRTRDGELLDDIELRVRRKLRL